MDKRHAYYKALLGLFETPGWKMFIEDVEDQIVGVRGSYKNCKDERELGICQGRETAFLEIATLESNIRAHMDALSEGQDNADI